MYNCTELNSISSGFDGDAHYDQLSNVVQKIDSRCN